MKNISTHTGILKLIERQNNSKNGNPRYLCFISETDQGHGFSFYSQIDHSHGYSLPNYFDKNITITIGNHYGKPMLDKIIKENIKAKSIDSIEDKNTKNYIDSQLFHLCPINPEKSPYIFKIKLFNDCNGAFTKHLNITTDQYIAIEKILRGLK